MRAEGSPPAPAVARVMASGCGAPAVTASSNQRWNNASGSAGISSSSSGKGSARRLLRHVPAQLLQRRPLQARDVHLADAEPARYLRLRHLLVEAHGHDRALARREMLHGAVQEVAHLDPLELGIGAADL